MSEETAAVLAPSLAQSDEAESGEFETLLAWSVEPDNGQAASVEPDRQPLPRSLVVLLTGVVVCAVGLGAFVVGELIDQIRFTGQPEYVFHHPLIRTMAYECRVARGNRTPGLPRNGA